MEVKKTKLTGCVSCSSDENSHGMHCKRCHAVALVMSMIHSNWSHDELEGLAKSLRNDCTHTFTETARGRGAFISARLGDRIKSCAPIAGISPDELKGRICSEIDRHRGEMSGIYEWERKNGKEGAYVKFAKEAILSWFGKTQDTKQ